MLTRDELQNQQREELEKLVRNLHAVRDQKEAVCKEFNAQITQLTQAVDSLLDDMAIGVTPLFDKSGTSTEAQAFLLMMEAAHSRLAG